MAPGTRRLDSLGWGCKAAFKDWKTDIPFIVPLHPNHAPHRTQTPSDPMY